MSRELNIVGITFAPGIAFRPPVRPNADSRRRRNRDLERLKQRFLKAAFAQTDDRLLRLALWRAAQDAAALAWATAYPLLVFPTLFEEMANAARQYAERQARLLRLSDPSDPSDLPYNRSNRRSSFLSNAETLYFA